METPEQLVAKLGVQLRRRQWMLCTAESCTGGLIAKTCTDIPGSSEWFERGLVTYSNQSKTDLLGVSETMLAEQGAVSEAVAQAMAVGALEHSRANIAVAVTGIAGPDGGSPSKPVGTVYFGFATEGKVITEVCLFEGTRAQIRMQSLRRALSRLLDITD